MSLLDKQEVQDICERTALRAKNGADLYVNERQKIQHYRARSTGKRRRRRMPNHDFFYLARSASMEHLAHRYL